MTTVHGHGRFLVRGAESQNLDHPFSNCIVVTNDVIQHLGEESDPAAIKAMKNGALISDMHGTVVIPGFIDHSVNPARTLGSSHPPSLAHATR